MNILELPSLLVYILQEYHDQNPARYVEDPQLAPATDTEVVLGTLTQEMIKLRMVRDMLIDEQLLRKGEWQDIFGDNLEHAPFEIREKVTAEQEAYERAIYIVSELLTHEVATVYHLTAEDECYLRKGSLITLAATSPSLRVHSSPLN